jgi:tetratricopeptide (TPR) repeat protein
MLTWIRASALALLAIAVPARAAEPPPKSPPPAPPAAEPAPAAPAAASSDFSPPPATPQEAEMQTHRALGHRLYRLGRYEEAVAAFRRAYEVKADARLLFDIAECYRELGSVDQALFYYDRYLVGWPDAFDRAEVEEKVAALEAKRGTPAPRATVARRRHPLMITEPPPSKPRPPARPWQRWWFWTVVGAGVLAGIGAGALSSRSESDIPATDLGDKRFY